MAALVVLALAMSGCSHKGESHDRVDDRVDDADRPSLGLAVLERGYAVTVDGDDIVVVPGRCWRRVQSLSLSAYGPGAPDDPELWMIVNFRPQPIDRIIVGRTPPGYDLATPLRRDFDGELVADLSLPEWGLLTSASLHFERRDLRPGLLLDGQGRFVSKAMLDRESCRPPSAPGSSPAAATTSIPRP